MGSVSQNQGQIPDPYAGRTDLQAALTAANSATGSAAINCSGSACTPAGSVNCINSVCTAQPGTYAGLKVTSGTQLVLAPGLFVFTGDVKSSGNGSITGSNITILMAAGHTIDLTANTVALNAATTSSAINQQLPGIVIGSLSVTSGKITGNSSVPLTGVIYYPNGQFEMDGSSASGSITCSVLIANSVVLTGNSSFAASDCSSYNVPTFFSIPGTVKRNAALAR
jgi:hypothetical protein